MDAPSLQPLPEAGGSRCAVHPDQPALGACTRCGTFFCGQDSRLVEDKPYCGACAERPDVDYLEAFRLQYWGKRDAWTWLVGIGAVVNLLSGLALLAGGPERLLFALVALGASVVGACFWLGQPWARLGFVFVPIVSLTIAVVTQGPAGMMGGAIRLIFAIAIIQSTRNKLFFKEEVSREALRQAWHLYMNNSAARAGFILGLLGLFVPGLGLIALVCASIGLSRVDPDAHPPIGRKGQAIAGLVLGLIGCAFWSGMMLYVLSR